MNYAGFAILGIIAVVVIKVLTWKGPRIAMNLEEFKQKLNLFNDDHEIMIKTPFGNPRIVDIAVNKDVVVICKEIARESYFVGDIKTRLENFNPNKIVKLKFGPEEYEVIDVESYGNYCLIHCC